MILEYCRDEELPRPAEAQCHDCVAACQGVLSTDICRAWGAWVVGLRDLVLEFDDQAIEAIAEICQQVNNETENIGARRLHTIMEYLLEDISFEASERKGERLRIDEAEVRRRLESIIESKDLSKYIL